MKVKLKDGKTLGLVSAPLGKGGEGNVHNVVQGQGAMSNLVAKLYKPEKCTSHQEQKIDFLINNAPNCESNGHTYLIWPNNSISQKGEFAGFLMPKASGVELEKLCLSKLDETLGHEWQRFAHGSTEAIRLRLSLCRNLSHAVASVHHKGCYVLVDMKPVNIFVNDKAMISIIDLDSVQVTERGHLLFANKAFTPEYTPPESVNQDKIRKSSWDDFTLAVIFYRLLTGIHPFSGSYNIPNLTEVSAAINAGLYPHGPKSSSFRVVPPLHQRLNQYPDSVAKLFYKCFVDGIHNPDQRPSAEEWFVTLNDILNAPPAIRSFDSSTDTVTDLSPIRLRWEIDNAVSIHILGVGDVTSLAEKEVTVKQNTTFILQAISFSGKKVEKSIVVRVDKRPPEIKFFKASNLVIAVGDSVDFRWELARAATITLTPGTGNLSAIGAVTQKPSTSTRYKLTAVSCFGVESSQHVDVTVYPIPEIQEFTLSHHKVKPRQSVTISWRCMHYQRIELLEGTSMIDVTGANNHKVNPTSNTEYTLKVTGHAGLRDKVATVKVEVLHDVKIHALSASRIATIQTVPTELRWQVKNAKKLVLEPGGLDVSGTSGIEVFPSTSTTYELIASHELHETRRSIRIDVKPLPRIENLRIPQPPNLQLKPPCKVWPLLPELLSGVAETAETDKILRSQVLPGESPLTGSISRLLYQFRKIMNKTSK